MLMAIGVMFPKYGETVADSLFGMRRGLSSDAPIPAPPRAWLRCQATPVGWPEYTVSAKCDSVICTSNKAPTAWARSTQSRKPRQVPKDRAVATTRHLQVLP